MMVEQSGFPICAHNKSKYLDATHLVHKEWAVMYETRTEYCHLIVATCAKCTKLHVVSNGLCWEHTFTLNPKDFESVLALANALSRAMVYHYTKDIAAERAGQAGYEPTIN